MVSSLKGQVGTGTVGVDYDWGGILAGLAVAYSGGRADYQVTDQASAKEASSWLISAHPYARAQILGDRLTAWGLLGYGLGEMTLAKDLGRRDRHLDDDGRPGTARRAVAGDQPVRPDHEVGRLRDAHDRGRRRCRGDRSAPRPAVGGRHLPDGLRRQRRVDTEAGHRRALRLRRRGDRLRRRDGRRGDLHLPGVGADGFRQTCAYC